MPASPPIQVELLSISGKLNWGFFTATGWSLRSHKNSPCFVSTAGNGWVAGIIITSDDWDHSRKFPTFSTSKNMLYGVLIHLHVSTINIANFSAGKPMSNSRMSCCLKWRQPTANRVNTNDKSQCAVGSKKIACSSPSDF